MVTDQGSKDSRRHRTGATTPPSWGLGGDRAVIDEETGQLSNPPRRPVQHRLTDLEIDELVNEYQAGRTLADLASMLGIHRRTVATHLAARGISRRVNRRKMTDNDVGEAARQYRTGDSLVKVALAFNVDAATLRRELHRAGAAIRPRRGWS
jgi:hypothetical protein